MSSKQAFLEPFDKLPASLPVQGLARAIIHNGLDFPTTRDENWKYTRINSIVNTHYDLGEKQVSDIEGLKLKGLEAIYCVFVNGVFQRKFSSTEIPSGLHIASFHGLDLEEKERLTSELGMHADYKNHAFSALNTSYFKDGAYVSIAQDAVIDKTIVILNITTGQQTACNPRTLVRIGKHAQVNLLLQYEGINNSGTFTNAVNEIIVEEGAHGKCYLIQNDGEGSTQVNTTEVVQKKASEFSVVTLTKSGDLVRNNLNFKITDEGCVSNMYGIYFTSGSQHVDNHTFADHLKPNCNSNELYKGVMTGKSTGVFNGKIMVHKDAQQTNAFQSNQNILLSKTASVNTKPELEIYADDVKCSHGCTIGQLDEEAMFYLQSRGLGKESASKLLIQAFAGDVLEFISSEPIRREMEEFIQHKFEQLNA